MRRRLGLLTFLVLLFGLTLYVGGRPVGAAPESAYVVNSPVDVPDANPGDDACETAAGNQVCTLRAAIQEANAHAPLIHR